MTDKHSTTAGRECPEEGAATTLYSLVETSARAGLSQQRDDGSMIAGHNGPYGDVETPVRNTAHWLITFLKAYEITGDEAFVEAAERAIVYLTSDVARPYGETFYHRIHQRKDLCNGLVGQAWTIEALSTAADALDQPDLADLAADVFLRHPFDSEHGVWQRVGVNGQPLPVDMTFNHQLWFATAGSHLNDARVQKQVQTFVDCLETTLTLYDSGLIAHGLQPYESRRGRLRFLLHRDGVPRFGFNQVLKLYSFLRNGRSKDDTDRRIHKAVGYHAFNTYAFALLYRAYPNHGFWDSEKFRRVLEYSTSDAYRSAIEDNKYGYPYNPPGIENALTLEVFHPKSTAEIEWWLSEQFSRCYDPDSDLMSNNDPDSTTYAARLYEVTRLNDYEVDLRDKTGRT